MDHNLLANISNYIFVLFTLLNYKGNPRGLINNLMMSDVLFYYVLRKYITQNQILNCTLNK